MVSRRAFVAGVLGAAGGWAVARPAAAWAGPARANLPTVADLFRSPLIGGAALSPRGERVAVLGQAAPAPGQPLKAFVDVRRAADAAEAVRIPLPDLEVESIDWAADDRLLVWAVISRTPAEPATRSGRGVKAVTWRRVIAMDPDGANPVTLFEDKPRPRAARLNLTGIVDPLIDDHDHVLMNSWDPAYDVAALYRVNVRDGRADLLERGVSSTVGWRCQGGDPVLRYDLDRSGRVMSLMARAPGDGAWRLVRRIEGSDVQDFQVVGATPEPGVVLVAARHGGEDAASVRTLDTRTLALGPALSARPDRDVADVLVNDRDRFVAAAYYEDRLSYDFVSPAMARRFKTLNKAFDDSCNVRLIDVDDSQSRWLAVVDGPRRPGTYVLYDTEARRVQALGDVRPWLAPEALAPMEAVEVKTRDGASIRAYVTRPVGTKGPRPLVVMPHGGPETRDHLTYHPWAQALAAQGWMVLQPNFRGSGGYGRAFAAAGWKRWGDRMQEDVEDAVDLLVRQKKADPRRIAIFGASYGGYSALMGAVRRPQLYKAVAAVAAPSDLAEMMRFEKKRQRSAPGVYAFWRARIGDPVEDALRLDHASPRQRAAEIRAPVFLAHGIRDDVVPVTQSRQMAQALKAAGRPCEVMEVNAGHADWGLHVEHTVIQRVVAFLEPALA